MHKENKVSQRSSNKADIKKIMDRFSVEEQLAYQKILSIATQKNNNDSKIDGNDVSKIIDEISDYIAKYSNAEIINK